MVSRRAAGIEYGYEGYVAKNEASPYEGGPTRRWLKA
jgi:ATP-dependent DNA ligase